MEILNIPVQWIAGVAFVIAAVYILLRGLRLPDNFVENEKARAELKKKVIEKEQQELVNEKETVNKPAENVHKPK